MTTSAAPQSFDHIALEERFERLSIKSLVPSPTNPRKHFATLALDDLTNSIREKGVLEPLIVRPRKGIAGKESFEIVAGERRWRAATQAGQLNVGCIIRNYSDDQALEVQLLENIQRSDLTPLEAAAGFRALIDKHPDRHSAASIATRTGMSITWVWETLSLNNLVPGAKKLLEEERITKGHALLIAAQTPANQKRIIEVDPDDLRGGGRDGLWRHDNARDLDLGDDDNAAAKKADPYVGLKPVSIGELASWIDSHIRFDVAHVAKAQPLDYGALAQQVDLVAKTVPITFEYHLAEDARDTDARTYGPSSWQRADGFVNPGEKKKSLFCDYSVLGLVVAGRGRGQAFQVCINRDKCKVHFKESVIAKEKAANLRAKGKTKTAAKVEKKAAKKQEDKWAVQQDERQTRQKAWDALKDHVIGDAVAQVKNAKGIDSGQAKYLENDLNEGGYDVGVMVKALGATWFKNPAAALLVLAAAALNYDTWNDKASGFDTYVKDVAKPLGLDIKRLTAVRDKHAPKVETPAPTKKAS